MEGGGWPEVGNNQVPQTFDFPSVLLATFLGYSQPPLGNSRGQDWVTYELNQHLLLSPRAPAVPTLMSCSLCLLPTGSTLYPPFPFVQFLFLFFLLLNDVVYGKK